jgi:flagellar hook-basal body complex protein FliE
MNTLSSATPGLSPLSPAAFPRADPGSAGRLVRSNGVAEAPAATPTGSPPGEGSFSSLLGRMVADVSAKQAQAGATVSGLQSGQPVTVHQAMIAMEEASVSFQLMAEVRNRLLESYQELMRMQV